MKKKSGPGIILYLFGLFWIFIAAPIWGIQNDDATGVVVSVLIGVFWILGGIHTDNQYYKDDN